ncbi:titin [Lingula anatina]|uniref:Titin n=1 Tax=Lingula anatina TaxID=7574 RepID=A0A1S3I5T3_LINAN|nr:titin [Lingula anatina]|eukprot:XP_013393635.1 titin [Lingula anatina]
MEPDLMEVGATLEEAIKLRQEHEELLHKLHDKQHQITELLARADEYVAQEKAYSEVYEAMAESLGEAWKDLNSQLETRRLLLDQSIAFHQSAQQFSEKMEQAQKNFSHVPLAQDVEMAKHLLQQHTEMKKGILEASMQTLQQGQELLDKIRVMGQRSDLQNRHATTAACYGIEHLLELLHDRRRQLEDLWLQRKVQLEQCLQLCQLDQECSKVLNWYQQVGGGYLSKTDLGDSAMVAQMMHEDHARFEIQAKEAHDTVLRLVRTADQLIHSTHYDSEGIRSRLHRVDKVSEEFMQEMENRRKNLAMAVSFYKQADVALDKLGQVEMELNRTDLPRNSTALVERHSQLSSTIAEVSAAALREGRILLERVHRDDPGANGVRTKMRLLQETCSRLETMCRAKPSEQTTGGPSVGAFQEQYNSVQNWISNIGHNTLTKHRDLGGSLSDAQDFLDAHRHLEKDLQTKSYELQTLASSAQALVKSGDQGSAQMVVDRTRALSEEWNNLQFTVERRIKLALSYVSFHKVANQVNLNFDSLDESFKVDKEEIQFITEPAVKHIQEKWVTTLQMFREAEQKGRNFISDSSNVQGDTRLEVRRSVATTESILTTLQQRKSHFTECYESWQLRVSSGKEFKVQWHQFVEAARKTIDWIMRAEKDLFAPNIAADLGRSAEAAQTAQQKLEQFGPTAKKAQAEIEKHLQTAEMLALKGDTKGQKDQIVNELLKVHQRFQARITEYQILLNMTIQFYKNLHQVDKLIEKTEQAYKQAELPNDVSRAEQMLSEHLANKDQVKQLINFTAGEGEQIVVRVRQQDSEEAAKEEVQKVLEITEERKQHWERAWDEQKNRLEQNVQLCQFNFDLRQVHREIDELSHQLRTKHGDYGSSLPQAKMTAEAFRQFEMTVALTQKKIQNFKSTADMMLKNQHYDSHRIRQELAHLEQKWSSFHTNVHEYRDAIDTSVKFFRLLEECDVWVKEATSLLINAGRKATECRTSGDATRLMQQLERFIEDGRDAQEEKISKISELTLQLYGPQGQQQIQPIIERHRDIIASYGQAGRELNTLKVNLQKREQMPTQEQIAAPPVPQIEVPQFQHQEIQVQQVAKVARAPEAPAPKKAKKDVKPPKIVQPLKDGEVLEGTRYVFECKVQSDTPPQVKWFKDGLPVSSPDYEQRFFNDTATLTIDETFSEDTAKYSCKITNEAGTTESSAVLRVKETHQKIVPPDFSKNLKSEEVLEGSSFTFDCHVTGLPSPSISWYQDKENIDNSPDFVITQINGICCLKIRRVTRAHDARYTCKAVNAGGAASSSARLTVQTPAKPIFTEPLHDIVTGEGKFVRMYVHFKGTPPPDITWRKNNQAILPSSVFKIETRSNFSCLEISEAYPEDTGTYVVVAKNTVGEARSTCQLTVEGIYSTASEEMSQVSEAEPVAPTFTAQLNDREAQEGHRVRLDCVIVGNPEPEVIWYHDGKPVKESKDFQLLFEGDRCTLIIREVYLEDGGQYKVVARNKLGEASSSCNLHVEPISELSSISGASFQTETAPPRFTQLLRDITAFEGKKIKFDCRLTGVPQPKLKWFRNEVEITNSPDYQITANGELHTLTIPEVFKEDAGSFAAVATNEGGEAKSYAKLHVKESYDTTTTTTVKTTRVETKEVKHSPPEFKMLFKDVHVRLGESVKFECVIAGSPKPKVTWFFNGEPIVRKEYRIIMESDRHTLYIQEVRPEDAGRFSVSAENASGKATCSALLVMEGTPGVTSPTRQMVSPVVQAPVSPHATVKQTRTITREEREVIYREMEYEGQVDRGQYTTTLQRKDTETTKALPWEKPRDETYQSTMEQQLKPKFQPIDMTIAIPVAPKFIEPIKSIAAREGTQVTFQGCVTGKPEPTIKWYKEGKDITHRPDVQTSYRDGRVALTIPKITKQDQGNFTCTASNTAGMASSSSELIVKANMVPPSFPQRLQSREVHEGKAVKLMVRVAGTPTPTVSWYREGAHIISSPDFEILQEGDLHTLHIPEVFYEDSGKFTVAAVNPAGEARCTAELIVEVPTDRERTSPSPPRPWQQVQETTRKIEQTVFLSQEKKVPHKPVAPPTPKVVVAPQKPVAAPPHPPAPKYAKMGPEPGMPKIMKPLRDHVVREGHKVVLEVHAQAVPEPIIKWYREEVEIHHSPDFMLHYSKGIATLTIAECFPEDSGKYVCVATNAHGSQRTQCFLRVEGAPVKQAPPPPPKPVKAPPVQKIAAPPPAQKVAAPAPPPPVQRVAPAPVAPPAPPPPPPSPKKKAKGVVPQIVEKPVNQPLLEGHPATFATRVTGQPTPEVIWSHRGHPIKESTRHRIDVDVFTGITRLHINVCYPEDEGDYTCTAVNPVGESSATAYLLGQDKFTEWQREEEMAKRKALEMQKQRSLVSELETRMTSPLPKKAVPEFFKPKKEPTYMSDVSMTSDDEARRRTPTGPPHFKVSKFEERLMTEIDVRDGRTTSASEAEYESEPLDRSVSDRLAKAPEIVTSMKNFKLMEGNDATFVCRVTSHPRPKIQWFKDGKRIYASPRIEIKFSPDGYVTLRIKEARPDDTGYYTMLAINTAGKATCSAELYVDALPKIDESSYIRPESLARMRRRESKTSVSSFEGSESGTEERHFKPRFRQVPQDLEVREGHVARFDCMVSGRPHPAVEWYRNGVHILDDAVHKVVVNEEGVHSLIIRVVTEQEAGTYTCIATNKGGTDMFQVNLNILQTQHLMPPRFTDRMHNISVKAHTPVTFHCAATGVPVPMMSWQKDGIYITPTDKYRVETDQGRSSLYIDNPDGSDNAWFQCSAVNIAGSASTRAKLTVEVETKKKEPERKLNIPKAKAVAPGTLPVSPAPIAIRRTEETMEVDLGSPPGSPDKPDPGSPPYYQIIGYSDEYASGVAKIINYVDLPRATSPDLPPITILQLDKERKMLKIVSPPSSPVKLKSPPTSPVKPKTPPVVPAKPKSPLVSPVMPKAPPSAPVKAKSPPCTPVKEKSPPSSPLKPDPGSPPYYQIISYSDENASGIAKITAYTDFTRELQEMLERHKEEWLIPMSPESAEGIPTERSMMEIDLQKSSPEPDLYANGYQSPPPKDVPVPSKGGLPHSLSEAKMTLLNFLPHDISQRPEPTVAFAFGDKGLEMFPHETQTPPTTPNPEADISLPHWKSQSSVPPANYPMEVDAEDIEDKIMSDKPYKPWNKGDLDEGVQWNGVQEDGDVFDVDMREEEEEEPKPHWMVKLRHVERYSPPAPESPTTPVKTEAAPEIRPVQAPVLPKPAVAAFTPPAPPPPKPVTFKVVPPKKAPPPTAPKPTWAELEFAPPQPPPAPVRRRPKTISKVEWPPAPVPAETAEWEPPDVLPPIAGASPGWRHVSAPVGGVSIVPPPAQGGFEPSGVPPFVTSEGFEPRSMEPRQPSPPKLVAAQVSFDKSEEVKADDFEDPSMIQQDLDPVTHFQQISTKSIDDDDDDDDYDDVELCNREIDVYSDAGGTEQIGAVVIGDDHADHELDGSTQIVSEQRHNVTETSVQSEQIVESIETDNAVSGQDDTAINVDSEKTVHTVEHAFKNFEPTDFDDVVDDFNSGKLSVSVTTAWRPLSDDVSQKPFEDIPQQKTEVTVEQMALQQEDDRPGAPPAPAPTALQVVSVDTPTERTAPWRKARPTTPPKVPPKPMRVTIPVGAPVPGAPLQVSTESRVLPEQPTAEREPFKPQKMRKDVLILRSSSGAAAHKEYILYGEPPAPADIYDKSKQRPPEFKTRPKDLPQLVETDAAHFECRLVPVGDPHMVVEWFFNGQLLRHGHRFRTTHDFGFVALDILYTYPEDSGEYVVRATNYYGTDEARAVLKCKGKRSVIMETQLPEGMEGVQRLQQMEEWMGIPRDETDAEKPKPKEQPRFVLTMESEEVEEGDTAKFMVKVDGHPRPRVTWWHNQSIVRDGARFKIHYDGMIHYLYIPKCREYNQGEVRCVARNTEGQVECSTTLKVKPQEDWRARLKRTPEPMWGVVTTHGPKAVIESIEVLDKIMKPKDRSQIRQVEKEKQEKISAYVVPENKMAERELLQTHVDLRHASATSDLLRHSPTMETDAEVHIERAKVQLAAETDEGAEARKKALLERKEPPVFTKPVEPIKTKEGVAVRFDVEFTGFPTPNITWYRDSFQIQPSRDFQISTQSTKSTLFIPEVFPEDDGMYTVKASNPYGMVVSKGKLTVLHQHS